MISSWVELDRELRLIIGRSVFHDMSGEDVVERIISDPRLFGKLTSAIYKKIKDEVVIKRLEELESTVKSLISGINELKVTVQDNTDHIRLLWENNERTWQEIRTMNERIDRILEENNKIWKEIQAIQKNIEGILMRLVRRGVFQLKILNNPLTGRKIKVVCLNKQQLRYINEQ